MLVLFVLTLITLLFLRVNKLQEVVTKEDVSEFMHGISDDVALQQGSSTDFETALKFPYDKTYEISKEKLKISNLLLFTNKLQRENPSFSEEMAEIFVVVNRQGSFAWFGKFWLCLHSHYR